MKSCLAVAAVAFAIMVPWANAAQAQTHRSHFGPHVSYNFDAEELGLGAQFSTPISSFLEFYPSFDYYLVNPGSLWALNADFKLRVAGENLDWLYLGGGLNVTRASRSGSGNTDTGLNLFAGFETIAGSVHPFGEMRLSFADGSSVQVAFGLNFTLGVR